MTIGAKPALSAQEVSVRRALNTVLPEVKFDNISLSDAVDFLRDVTGANMHVNWRALEGAGVGKDALINLRMRSVQLSKVLRLVLSEAGSGNAVLTYYDDDNVLEVTTREIADSTMFTKVYPVDDLLMEIPDFVNPPTFNIQQTPSGRGGGGGGNALQGAGTSGNQGMQMTREQRAQQLIDTIQTIVKPEIWNTNGGPGAIRFFNGALIVTAPRSVHEALSAQ